jgi:hypothetical protein
MEVALELPTGRMNPCFPKVVSNRAVPGDSQKMLYATPLEFLPGILLQVGTNNGIFGAGDVNGVFENSHFAVEQSAIWR